jgi:hypothetical protein
VDAHESLYLTVARNMSGTGDWIVPIVNGVAFLDKPPLLYWLTAIFTNSLAATCGPCGLQAHLPFWRAAGYCGAWRGRGPRPCSASAPAPSFSRWRRCTISWLRGGDPQQGTRVLVHSCGVDCTLRDAAARPGPCSAFGCAGGRGGVCRTGGTLAHRDGSDTAGIPAALLRQRADPALSEPAGADGFRIGAMAALRRFDFGVAPSPGHLRGGCRAWAGRRNRSLLTADFPFQVFSKALNNCSGIVNERVQRVFR